MLGSHNLIAFVATRDASSAKAFYRDTLGLRMISEDPFALVFDAQGTMLRVSIVDYLVPAHHTVLGWQVPDIDAAARALDEAGVKPERFEGLKQDDLGIWTAPGGAQVAWFKDPDGNILSITQFGD